MPIYQNRNHSGESLHLRCRNQAKVYEDVRDRQQENRAHEPPFRELCPVPVPYLIVLNEAIDQRIKVPFKLLNCRRIDKSWVAKADLIGGRIESMARRSLEQNILLYLELPKIYRLPFKTFDWSYHEGKTHTWSSLLSNSIKLHSCLLQLLPLATSVQLASSIC